MIGSTAAIDRGQNVHPSGHRRDHEIDEFTPLDEADRPGHRSRNIDLPGRSPRTQVPGVDPAGPRTDDE